MGKKSDEEESWLLEYADIKFRFILRIEIFFCPADQNSWLVSLPYLK